MTELPLLQRRETEARILAPIVAALADRFGREAVMEVLAETIKGLAKDHGGELARTLGRNTLADLAQVLAMWREDGSLEAGFDANDLKFLNQRLQAGKIVEHNDSLSFACLPGHAVTHHAGPS